MPLLDDVVVREFRMDDKQLVTDFFDQMGGESRSFINRGESSRILSMKFFEGITEDRVMFLAEYEGRMVGFIFLFENNTSIPFFGIAVHDAYKGRRIGEKMIEHIKLYARAHGKGGLFLTVHPANVRAQALYERVGFKRMGVHHSGENLYVFRFED